MEKDESSKEFHKPENPCKMLQVESGQYHEFDGNKGPTSTCVWNYLNVLTVPKWLYTDEGLNLGGTCEN